MINESKPISFKHFQVLLADILEVDPEKIEYEAFFVTDLGADSLKLTEMLLHFQALGFEISPDLAWRIQTVGEAYRYYQEQAGK